MDKNLEQYFEMRAEGRQVELAVVDDAKRDKFPIVPADAVAFISGVNIGSVIKVFAAMEYIDLQGGKVRNSGLHSLYSVPKEAPAEGRLVETAAYIRAALANQHGPTEIIATALRLDQRAMRLR